MEELKFSVDNDGIGISIIEDLGTLRKRRIIQYMNTKDEAIRQELIKMGWTPPKGEDEKLCEDVSRVTKDLAASVIRAINAFDPKEAVEENLPFTQRGLKDAVLGTPEETRTPRFKRYAPLAPEPLAKKEELTPIEKGLLATFPCLGGGIIKLFSGKPPRLEEAPPSFKAIHEAFRTLTHAVHANAVEHGWWEEDRGTEPLLLMHTEISEAVEALRAGNPESKKIPGHSHVAEELADVVIRVLDYCGKHNINIGAAITAKHEYNRSRPYRHGGKKF